MIGSRIIERSEAESTVRYSFCLMLEKRIAELSKCKIGLNRLDDISFGKPILFSLSVIVPEGVEHPRKRQARERAELEAKGAAAP